MPIVQVNNKNIHLLEMNHESSQAIVMIHGMFTNLSVFYFNISPNLSDRFRVVMYDLKGHGMSERSDHGYDLESMSNDLIALMDTLQLNKVHLIGYSYGGLIALKTALLYPGRVEKLIVIESPRPDQGDSPEMIQKFGNEFIDQYLNNYESTTALKPGRRQIEKNRQLFDYLFNHTSIKEDFNKDNDFFDQIEKNPVGHKTLLLYGESSDCLQAGELLHQMIPGSVLQTTPGNHNLPVQEPQWITNQINSFLR